MIYPQHTPNYRFLSILRCMVDTESNAEIIRWNEPGDDHGFTIVNISRLEELLEKYF